MSTETGGSSTATGIVNLEMSTISEDSMPEFSIGCLISVPDFLRKTDEQAFTPRLISIGPIHRSNAKLQVMKKCKEQFRDSFIRRANINLQFFQETIRKREHEIRSFYSEAVVSSISSDDFVTMILVDGLFILEYFLRESYPILDDSNPMIKEWMPPILKFDLVLLENQLPFFVLEILFKSTKAILPAELRLEPRSLEQLACEFFQCYNFQMKTHLDFNQKIEHFTDLVRLFYLSEQLPERRLGGAKLSYSAMQLHEAGVKFKGVFYSGGRNFLDITFDLQNKVLEILHIKLNDEKIRLVRNIIALEQSLYVGNAYVTDFFVMLDSLINTSEDVELLCDEGIIDNYLGDNNAVASVVNNINTNISKDYMRFDYSRICEDLNACYNASWHKWMAKKWRKYLRNIWQTASISAAILLLLTLTQTICSIKSTKW